MPAPYPTSSAHLVRAVTAEKSETAEKHIFAPVIWNIDYRIPMAKVRLAVKAIHGLHLSLGIESRLGHRSPVVLQGLG